MALTDRQERFCKEYMVDANATQAYIRAGYAPHSAHSHAARLMASPEVRARIRELAEKRDTRLIATGEEVMQYLTGVMRGQSPEDAPAIRDRTRAAELLGKRYGLFADRVEAMDAAPVVIVDDVPLNPAMDEWGNCCGEVKRGEAPAVGKWGNCCGDNERDEGPGGSTAPSARGKTSLKSSQDEKKRGEAPEAPGACEGFTGGAPAKEGVSSVKGELPSGIGNAGEPLGNALGEKKRGEAPEAPTGSTAPSARGEMPLGNALGEKRRGETPAPAPGQGAYQ